jgi:hypothetical protein
MLTTMSLATIYKMGFNSRSNVSHGVLAGMAYWREWRTGGSGVIATPLTTSKNRNNSITRTEWSVRGV